MTYIYSEQKYQLTLAPQAEAANTWDALIAQVKVQEQQQAAQNASHFSVTMDRALPQMVGLEVNEEHSLAFVAQRGYEVLVSWHGVAYRLEKPRPLDVDAAAAGGLSSAAAPQKLVAPMAGTIVKVYVQEGAQVEARQTLLVLSAMKMEHSITATHAGVVKRLPFAEGAAVPGGAVLVELGEAGDAQPEGEQDNGAL